MYKLGLISSDRSFVIIYSSVPPTYITALINWAKSFGFTGSSVWYFVTTVAWPRWVLLLFRRVLSQGLGVSFFSHTGEVMDRLLECSLPPAGSRSTGGDRMIKGRRWIWWQYCSLHSLLICGQLLNFVQLPHGEFIKMYTRLLMSCWSTRSWGGKKKLTHFWVKFKCMFEFDYIIFFWYYI